MIVVGIVFKSILNPSTGVLNGSSIVSVSTS